MASAPGTNTESDDEPAIASCAEAVSDRHSRMIAKWLMRRSSSGTISGAMPETAFISASTVSTELTSTPAASASKGA
eukprot:3075753-Prymnesium_polylepis.2